MGSEAGGIGDRTGAASRGIPWALTGGIVVVALSSAAYAYAETLMRYVTPQLAGLYQWAGLTYLLILVLGSAMVALGLIAPLRRGMADSMGLDVIQLAPGKLFPYLLTKRRYLAAFSVSSLAYAMFYSVVTGILVVRPGGSLGADYHVAIPSVYMAACCGPPLEVPLVTAYLTESVALLLIPLSVMLMLLVSALVGLNAALVLFAFDSEARGGSAWVGGMAAVVGLFTGCPTCAGLVFAYLVGGAGAIATASALAYYQPLFIGASIPVLILTPFLTSRSLRKVFTRGCVVRPNPSGTGSDLRN
jgi:hypothetical protein